MKFEIEKQAFSIPLVEKELSLALYLAKPVNPGSFPLIIVGMEIFGVNKHIRSICDNLAEEGCIAVAPDYYSGIAPGTALGYSPVERERGLNYMKLINRDEVLEQTSAVISYLESIPNNSGKIGFVGFSIGGHIGYYCATRLPIDLTICFYAGWLSNTDILLSQPTPTVNETMGIAKQGGSLLFIKGEQDHLITPDQDAELEKALTQAGVRHQLVIYPATGHGFFCEERPATFNKLKRDESWNLVLSTIAAELVECH